MLLLFATMHTVKYNDMYAAPSFHVLIHVFAAGKESKFCELFIVL